MEKDFFLDRYILIECPDGTFVIHKILRKIKDNTYVVHPCAMENGEMIRHLGHVLVNMDNLTSEGEDYPKAQVFDDWATVSMYFKNIGASAAALDDEEDDPKPEATVRLH